MKWSIWLLGFELLTIEQSDGTDDSCVQVDTVDDDGDAPGLTSHFGFAGEGPDDV